MTDKEKRSYVRRYFELLTASDIGGIIELFEPSGKVESPYLGRILASEFFTKLGKASQQNKLTVFDVLIGEKGDSAAAHFEYDWTLSGGDKIVFQGVDYFKFSERGKFSTLSIYYDTHPTRMSVGDQLENA